jgi:hypothetical protein
MKRLVWIILLTAWAPYLLAAEVTPAAEPASKYRVSGVVAVGAQDWMVLVESEDGKYQRIRVGDKLEGGEVLEIAPRWMRIAFPMGEQVWRLTPGERPVRQRTAATPTGGQQVAGAGDWSFRLVGPKVVEALERELEFHAKDTRTDASLELVALLERLLDIEMPPEARAVSIDHQPLGSMHESLKVLHQSLSTGRPVSFTLEGVPSEHERLYLAPQAPSE